MSSLHLGPMMHKSLTEPKKRLTLSKSPMATTSTSDTVAHSPGARPGRKAGTQNLPPEPNLSPRSTTKWLQLSLKESGSETMRPPGNTSWALGLCSQEPTEASVRAAQGPRLTLRP